MSAHENATPRPWWVKHGQRRIYGAGEDDGYCAPVAEIVSKMIAHDDPRVIQFQYDAALIVEAVNAYDTLRAENERLKSFARRIIGTSAFEGNDLDGSYVQMIAENRELITRCIYDPERHGPSEYAEPGDNFYEFAPILCGPALSEPAQ